MRNHIRNILTVWMLLCGTAAFAGELQPITGILKSTIASPVLTGDSLEIHIDSAANAKDYRVKNIVSLSWDQNTDTFLTAATSVRLHLLIYRWNKAGAAMATRKEDLIVSASNGYNRSTVDRAALKLDDGYRVLVVIDNIYINGSGVSVVPRFVSLESEIRLERYYDFSLVVNDPVSDIAIDTLNTDCDDGSTIDELKVHWSTVPEAEEYQLEWTYINDYGVDTLTAFSASQLTADFKNNSTRITTAFTEYRIALTFDRGYIAFRVRAVGRDYLHPDVYMYSVWSAADKSPVSAVSAGSVFYNWYPHEWKKNWQYSSTFAEEGKKKEVISYFDGSLHNRQSVTKINSDHNAIVGETLYDFQGRPAVNVLPAPVALPACDSFGTTPALRYYSRYNRNFSDSSYSKNDFDLDDTSGMCSPVIPGMDTLSGSSQYYSANNPNKSFQQAFVPDAEYYPFSQVEYTPDNTGRIRSQSGVGKKFQLGSGHETKYFYGAPAQLQLDRLFGSEAGDASHYKKNVVMDANGQASVSYLNQEGKTIATALAGNAPADSTGTFMEALPSEAEAASAMSVDLFNKNSSGQSLLNKITPMQDAVEFSTQLLVTSSSTYKFNYDMNISALQDSCLGSAFCMSCIYDLEIRVSDECGNNLTASGTYDNQPIHKMLGRLDSIPNGFTMNCSDESGTAAADSISIDLSPGVYTVSKVLTINRDARDFYVKNYMDTLYNSCVRTINDFIDDEMASLDTSSCVVSCSTCAAALGTKDDYVSSGRGTELQYDMLYEACLAPCREKTLCEASFDMMVLDVSPGGQYGRFDPETLGSSDPISVFNTHNGFNGNMFSSSPQHWKRPQITINGSTYYVYIDDDGLRKRITVELNNDLSTYTPEVDDASKVYTDSETGDLYTYPENLRNLKDFIPAWDPYFARSLVLYHPEYAYYKACSLQGVRQAGDSITSDQFDSLLMATQTFAEALANGFIKSNYSNTAVAPNDKVYDYLSASSSHIYDPFFTSNGFGLSLSRPGAGSNVLSHTTLLGMMNTVYQNYVTISGMSYSMVEMAAYLSRCGNNFSSTPTAACMGFGTDFFGPVVANYVQKNDSIRNKEWQMLKTFYLSEKRKIQYHRMEFYAKYYNWSVNFWQGGCNTCIGNTGFTLLSGGMYVPHIAAAPTVPALNRRQPCSIFTYPRYAAAQKRFISPTNSGLDPGTVPALMYQQTGQCPMALLLQTFLANMAQDSLLNSSTPVDMNTVSAFSVDMYNALNGGAVPSLFINYQWDLNSITSGVLSADIKNPVTGMPACSMTLDISSTPVGGFQDIIGIRNLTYDHMSGSDFYFRAVAIYRTSPSTIDTAGIRGSSCLNIKDCNFEEQCSGNQFAADVQNLMNMLSLESHITATNYNISRDTVIAPFITSTVKNMLGAPYSTLMWNYSAPYMELYDSTNSSTRLRFTVLNTSPSVSFSAIKIYSNIKSFYNNLYKVDAFDSAGTQISVVSGKAEKITPAGTTGISMGECGLPEPPECTLQEHQVRKDLEKLLNEVLTAKPFVTNINFYDQVNFSPLLQSYLTIADTSTYTNIYTPTHIPKPQSVGTNTGSCSLSFVQTTSLPYDSLISVTNLTGTGVADANGNFHNFYFLAMYSISGVITTDTIRGASCWPLKNCNHCDSTMVTPVASDSNTVSIPEVYHGWGAGPADPVLTDLDSSDCMVAYAQLISAINNYNASAYAAYHHDTLDASIYPNADLFMSAGYCNCATQYINYLDNYLTADTSEPLPVNIDHFTGCSHVAVKDNKDLCKRLFNQYHATVTAYNAFVDSHPSLHYPRVDEVPDSIFMQRYCNCFARYQSNLGAIIYGFHPDSATVFNMIDIDKACATPPCVPAGPGSPFVFPPLTYSPNPCVQQAINIALLNAQNDYEQYVDSITTDISQRYTEHCLSAFENFTYGYTDKEYHYTLYYYDQAGNLVKTIPPEGVELLDIHSSTDPLEVQIRYDRDHAQQQVFTSHRMATAYKYNSLNQLVYQDMPDHDKMTLVDFTLPNGLDSRLNIIRTQFVSASKGYLSGYIAGGNNRGYLYTTDNGGANWQRVNNTVGANINDVFFVSSTTGYAVGDHATILNTTDGGASWDEKNLHYTYRGNLYATCFSSSSDGVVGGVVSAAYSGIYRTTDGGGTYSAGSGFTAGDTITGITYDGSNYYATVKAGSRGGIYYSSNGASWTPVTQLRAGDLAKVHYMSHTPGSLFAYAAGADGTLLKTAANSTSTWNVVATGISKPFRDIYFKNENEGIAIIDSAANKGRIWKTFDSGHTWELLSDAGDYYVSLQEYDRGKVLATGENGLIAKVLMTYAPFSVVKLQAPSAVSDLYYADAVLYAGNPKTIAVGGSDTLYYKKNASLGSPGWSAVKTTALGVSGGDGSFRKVQLKDEGNPTLKGALLTQNGKIYRLYKDAGDVFSFALATVTDLSSTPVSSYFFNDLTMDTHVSSKFYAYDTISKRVFTGTILTGTSPGLTFTYADTVTVQQRNIRSIAVDSAAANMLLAGDKGSIKHKSSPNSSTTNYSNRRYDVKPLPLNSISATGSGGLYAAGNDGAIWTTGNGTEWKLLNTGISDRINCIRLNTGTGDGAIACDNGRLYAQSIVDSLNITLSAIDINTTENLTALAVAGSNAYAGTAGGAVIHVPDLGTATYANVNVQAMNGGFRSICFLPSSSTVYAAGDNVAMYQCIYDNSARVNELFLSAIAGSSFANANNGYIATTTGDIRHTADGGNSWQIVTPTVSGTFNNIYTVKPGQAILIGTNKYFAVINGDNVDTAFTVSGGASNVQLTNIDFNQNNYGIMTGSKRSLYSLEPDGNSFTVTYLSQPPPMSAGEYALTAVKVFPDNSFFIVGNRGRMFYYKGGTYYRQVNYDALADTANSIFRDCYFHDDRTCYAVGDNGIALKCTLGGNIMNSGYGDTPGSMAWDTLHLSDPYSIYNSVTQGSISLYTIDFADRQHGFIGGLYNTAPTNARYAMQIDDNSGYYSTRFFYDRLGRMVVSQNTKQYNKQAFSYTRYDALGRIKEVGEKEENTDSAGFRRIFGSMVNGLYNPNTINDDSLGAWLAGDGLRTEVTKTYYDTVSFSIPLVQEHLRKRVAGVTYEDTDDNIDSTYEHATHYTYDIHGNVRTLLQDNRKMYDTAVAESSAVALQRFKRIDYEYDLISGKVNRVIYQPGAPDQFIHRYSYDADNRITRVETSTDDLLYDLDAKYFYYEHGPLARVEYGKNQVQGQDYVYTLQGWIKGVNSNTLYAGRDPGKDGYADTANLNNNFGRDAYGYTLGYYDNDYKAIDRSKRGVGGFEASTSITPLNPHSQYSAMDMFGHDLYNGNIAHMATTIVTLDSASGVAAPQIPHWLGNAYRYDQLNRLLQSSGGDNMDHINNVWKEDHTLPLYENTFTYDANGNILSQRRADNTSLLDDLTYNYKRDVSGNLLQNRLYHVNDSRGNSFGDDLGDQGTFDPTEATVNSINNYRYDPIGNLQHDSIEEIESVKWTVYGKIKEIKRSIGSSKKNINFDYDAGGNRIAKHVLDNSGNWINSTFYVRDAQGNVMSTYRQEAVDTTMSFKLSEQHVYGSSRLGMATPEKEMLGADTTAEFAFDTLNKKQYELANHLGNVLTVIYDRKVALDTNSDSHIDYYLADLASSSDYSPFGAPLANRGFKLQNYRYGFNGKENDNEVKGDGNQQDYGMRVYDPRLGRFLSVDPLSKDYPELTPYQFASNTPIYAIDMDGLEACGNPIAHSRGNTGHDCQLSEKTPFKERAEQIIGFGSVLGGGLFAVGATTAGTAIKVVIAPAVTGGMVNSSIAIMKGESGTKIVTSFVSGFVSGAVLGAGASSTLFQKAATGGFAGVIGEYSQQILDIQAGINKNNEIDFLKIAEAGGLGSLASSTADILKDKIGKYIEQKVAQEVDRLLSDKNVKTLVKELRIANPGMSNKDIVKYATNQLTQAAQYAVESGVNLKVAMYEAIDKSMDVINSKVQDKVEQLKKKNE